MANTVISLKKSATPSAVPASEDLSYGEIAINYADGKLFFKAANDSIYQIGGDSYSFGTIDANGTLIVSDAVGDVVSLITGSNIEIVGDAINDTITITANLLSAFLVANSAYDHANTIYTYAANTVNLTANMAYANAVFANTVAIAAFDKANTGGGGGASVAVSDVAPGSPTANSLWWNSSTGKMYIYYADGTSSQWVETSPGEVIANGAMDVATAALSKANTINVRSTPPLNITVSATEPTGNSVGDVWIDIS